MATIHPSAKAKTHLVSAFEGATSYQPVHSDSRQTEWCVLNNFTKNFSCYRIKAMSVSLQVYLNILFPATKLFRLMDKYRPETKVEKVARRKIEAEKRLKDKTAQPAKRAPTMRSGINTVTTLVEKKKTDLVVISHDVDPIEVGVLLCCSHG